MSSSTKYELGDNETKNKTPKGAMSNNTGLTVLIMNANGPSCGKGFAKGRKKSTQKGETPAERRKMAIQNVINKHDPNLVLFQEFSWKGIHGTIWKADPIPEHFELAKNGDDCSILYNINEITAEEMLITELYRILMILNIQTRIENDFAPIPRMSLRVVTKKDDKKFICISWHGKHSGMKEIKKKTAFKDLMTFLNEVYERNGLPILIAGDFNVEMKLIKDEVKEPFKLYEYQASERREEKGVIDYFIATTELHLSDIKPVDLKKDSKADNPEEVLDHDPIIAMLEPARENIIGLITISLFMIMMPIVLAISGRRS